MHPNHSSKSKVVEDLITQTVAEGGRRYSLLNTSSTNRTTSHATASSSPFTGLFRYSSVNQTIDELSENVISFGRRSSMLVADKMAASHSSTTALSNHSVCQRCKTIEIDLTNTSDSLNATDAELKASRQVISLLQRQLELFQIEKEGLEKIISNCQQKPSENDKLANELINLEAGQSQTVTAPPETDRDNSISNGDVSSGDMQENVLKLIKTQLYDKDEEIVKLKYNLKQTQNEKEQLILQVNSLEEEGDRLKSEIAVLKENLALRDQTIVSLSNEVFEQGNPSDYIATNSSVDSSFGLQRNQFRTERQIAKFIETIDAYKKTNELLSANVIKLTDKCAQAEKKEIETRSQCQELEAKCCQIQSKLLSLLKEIEQASKPQFAEGSDEGDNEAGSVTAKGTTSASQEFICSESVRLLIKRLLEDKSLDIPLSWKEGNKSKRDKVISEDKATNFKYECDELGFYITSKEEEEVSATSSGSQTTSPISSFLTRRNKLMDNLSSPVHQLRVVEEAMEATEGSDKQIAANKLKFTRQVSVDATKTDEVRWRNAWDEFIKDFENIDLSKSSRFKNLLRCGVPQEYRCKVWKALVDLKIGKERQEYGPDYYQSLLEPNRPNEPNKKLNPSSKQIELDLLRTLPNNKYFETLDSSGTIRLRRVLTAFSEHDPKVGYCQGMNRLAAVALLVLPEEEAFWCLKTIVDKIMPKGYYNDLWLAQVDSNVVMDFVGLKMPALSDHFNQNGIELSLFAWFLTIFVDGTPPALFLRLWDSFLYEGDKILFRVALALLKINESHLLKLSNSVTVNNFLRLAVNKPMNMDYFFDVAFDGINPFSSRALRVKRLQNFQILRAGLQRPPTPPSNDGDRVFGGKEANDVESVEDSSIMSV